MDGPDIEGLRQLLQPAERRMDACGGLVIAMLWSCFDAKFQ
jgi:hypothetical protein